MKNIDRLKGHVDRLQGLLNDPHPGLASWCSAVADQWRAIAEMWDSDETA